MVSMQMQANPTLEQVLSYKHNELKKIAVDILGVYLFYTDKKYPHFEDEGRTRFWACLSQHTGIDAERLKSSCNILKSAEYALIIRFGYAYYLKYKDEAVPF